MLWDIGSFYKKASRVKTVHLPTQVDNSIPQRLLPCQVRRLLHTSESAEKVLARTPLRSISLLKNKQLLQETSLKALSRVGNTPTLQNSVLYKKEFGSSEIPAYESRRIHDHRSCLHHLRKRLHGHRYLLIRFFHVEFTTT